MTTRDRLEAFWAGEKPDRIPLTIYGFFCVDADRDPDWQRLFAQGLAPVYHAATFNSVAKDVETVNDTFSQNDQEVQRTTLRTPVGEVFTTAVAGWRQKHWLRTADDYRVMTWIVEHTEITAAPEAFSERERAVTPHGIVLAATGRTPLQTILVDHAGLEHFAYHLADLEDEVMTLYHALLKNYRKIVEITAEGPGRYVSVGENFTAETLGPARFRRHLLPVYEELFPALRSAGKIVGTHFDGKLASCRELIASAPINLIESLTCPPEGDMTLAECRAAWPDKLLWANINVSLFDLPPAALRSRIHELVRQGAPDGRRLALEISEDLPLNWRQSIPIVLDSLCELWEGARRFLCATRRLDNLPPRDDDSAPLRWAP